MRSRFAAFQNRALRLDDIAADIRIALAQILRDAGECTARSRAGDVCVNASFHLLPDFRRGRFVVCVRVERIRELLRDVRIRDVARQLFRARDRAFHPGVFRRQLDATAERFHHFPLFRREVFGNAEDDFVSHARTGEREADAGITCGRLDDRAARFEQACFRGALDHPDSDPIFDRAAGIEELELYEDVGIIAAADVAQPKHRRRADEIEDVVGDGRQRAGHGRGF